MLKETNVFGKCFLCQCVNANATEYTYHYNGLFNFHFTPSIHAHYNNWHRYQCSVLQQQLHWQQQQQHIHYHHLSIEKASIYLKFLLFRRDRLRLLHLEYVQCIKKLVYSEWKEASNGTTLCVCVCAGIHWIRLIVRLFYGNFLYMVLINLHRQCHHHHHTIAASWIPLSFSSFSSYASY